MTPEQFVAKWKGSRLGERQASQEQFIDLCRLLEEKTPAEADATGETYCFVRGAAKMDGGDGWADVWKRGHFAWEYKGRHKDLDEAYRQLQQYRDDLENPPLLVVSDMERFIVRTNWTNTVQRRHEFCSRTIFGAELWPMEIVAYLAWRRWQADRVRFSWIPSFRS